MSEIADAILWIVYLLFGAVAGICYPPKSRRWAQWQLLGLALGLIAALAFTFAVIVAICTDHSRLVWPAALIGMGFASGLIAIGTICRWYHEEHRTKSPTIPEADRDRSKHE